MDGLSWMWDFPVTLIATDTKHYRLLPFRLMRMKTGNDRDILLTSDTGEYLHVNDVQICDSCTITLINYSYLSKSLGLDCRLVSHATTFVA